MTSRFGCITFAGLCGEARLSVHIYAKAIGGDPAPKIPLGRAREARAKVPSRIRVAAPGADLANVYPHFIGVFELGRCARQSRLLTALFTGVYSCCLLAGRRRRTNLFTPFQGHPGRSAGILALSDFLACLPGVLIAPAALVAFGVYVFTHFKWDFSIPGYIDWGKHHSRPSISTNSG